MYLVLYYFKFFSSLNSHANKKCVVRNLTTHKNAGLIPGYHTQQSKYEYHKVDTYVPCVFNRIQFDLMISKKG